ncbi:unnamed protein product [Auanema sp. JU1783]|nr:unnamed protein product [Auanema sp. JU1783]
MTMRLFICVMVFISTLTQAYYLGNPDYYGRNDLNRLMKAEEYPIVMPEMWPGSDSSNRKQQLSTLQKEKKAAFAPIKRFRPCYYSPIQCLIKRR